MGKPKQMTEVEKLYFEKMLTEKEEKIKDNKKG